MAIATVRVRTATDGKGDRPEKADMERAADLLRERGFEVLRVGRFGVNIQGDDGAFQRELGVDVAKSAQTGGLVETPRAAHKELSSLIDSVEIAGPPTNFA
jgi:hypothetical protein